jgi:hypothetical protein
MARDLIHEIDHSMPAAQHASLGTLLQKMILNFNSVLTKLDGAGAATTATGLAAQLGTNNVSSLKITDLKTAGLTAN